SSIGAAYRRLRTTLARPSLPSTTAANDLLRLTTQITHVCSVAYRCKSMKISDAEAQIMALLWRGAPMTPEEISAEVGPANDWAPGTVRTLVHRLLRKKAIAGSKEGGRYLYRPLISRDAYVQHESMGFLERMFDGQVAPLVAHLAKHRALTAKDL